MTDYPEKRRHPRRVTPSNLQVALSIVSDPCQVELSDLSRGGLFIHSSASLPRLGQQVTYQFLDHQGHHFGPSGQGTVVRLVIGPLAPGFALRFSKELTREEEQHLLDSLGSTEHSGL
jgi:hypothetical protein